MRERDESCRFPWYIFTLTSLCPRHLSCEQGRKILERMDSFFFLFFCQKAQLFLYILFDAMFSLSAALEGVECWLAGQVTVDSYSSKSQHGNLWSFFFIYFFLIMKKKFHFWIFFILYHRIWRSLCRFGIIKKSVDLWLAGKIAVDLTRLKGIIITFVVSLLFHISSWLQ